MKNQKESQTILKSRIVIISLLIAVVISSIYLLLSYGWIKLNSPQNAPSYILEEPLRQFFVGSIASVLILFYPLNRIIKREESRAQLILSLGFIITIIGTIGIFIILPIIGVTSNPGGLTPDFGHILIYENFTGSLWLFLLFSGPMIYLNGYLASQNRKNLLCKLLPIILAFPAYYIGAGIYDMISFIRESGGLKGKLLFSVVTALLVTLISWLSIKLKNK